MLLSYLSQLRLCLSTRLFDRLGYGCLPSAVDALGGKSFNIRVRRLLFRLLIESWYTAYTAYTATRRHAAQLDLHARRRAQPKIQTYGILSI